MMPSATSGASLDEEMMGLALGLARGMLGKTAPNPSVGCVIVRHGAVLGRGATQAGGRPHAEAVALADAGGLSAVQGATAYVSLEPCAHKSARGPACADLLIEAGIARVVIGAIDPDPRTVGQGLRRLEAAGIQCELGPLAADAQKLIGGFEKRLRTGMPFVLEAEDATSFDAAFAPQMQEPLREALIRHGNQGLLRVWVPKGSLLARALNAEALLDFED
jgi:diaminohydroxyphosphoribosylaminopyrimidine deaminase / 5-amino-6-(5-phosphoribosylamino)uracil reductase